VWFPWWCGCATSLRVHQQHPTAPRPTAPPPHPPPDERAQPHPEAHAPAKAVSDSLRLRGDGGARSGPAPCCAGGRRQRRRSPVAEPWHARAGPQCCWLRPARATVRPRPHWQRGRAGGRRVSRKRPSGAAPPPAWRCFRGLLVTPRRGGQRGAVVGPMWPSTNHTSPPAVRRCDDRLSYPPL